MAAFVDRVVLHARARRRSRLRVHSPGEVAAGEADGGDGGALKLVVDSGVHTLLDFRFHPHQRAENGKGGQGSNRDGAGGSDLVLRVPDGTWYVVRKVSS